MRYLFIEEISMVGQVDLCSLNEKLNEKFAARNFGEDSSNHWLGGINVVSAGDFKQLAPIAKVPLWVTYDVQKECKTVAQVIDDQLVQQQERKQSRAGHKGHSAELSERDTAVTATYSSAHGDVTVPVGSAQKENILGRQVWEFMSSQNVIMLTEQMRVTDTVYYELLQHVRNGTCTEHHRKLLQSRLVQNVGAQFYLGNAEWRHVPTVVSGNVQRECVNRRCTVAFAQATGNPIVVFSALDSGGCSATTMTMQRHTKALQAMNADTVY
jgi:hypothetical protein